MCANTPINMMMDESLVIEIVICGVTIHTILKMFEIVIFQSKAARTTSQPTLSQFRRFVHVRCNAAVNCLSEL